MKEALTREPTKDEIQDAILVLHKAYGFCPPDDFADGCASCWARSLSDTMDEEFTATLLKYDAEQAKNATS